MEEDVLNFNLWAIRDYIKDECDLMHSKRCDKTNEVQDFLIDCSLIKRSSRFDDSDMLDIFQMLEDFSSQYRLL